MFTSLFTLAQQSKFDSLKRLLPQTNVPQKRVVLLIDIASSIYFSTPDSSIEYCEKAEALSKKYNLEVQLAYSLHCESRYLLLKGDIKTTIEKLNKAISLFEKNNELKGLAKCYSLKSVAVGRLKQYNEQLVFLLKTKSIYTQLNDKRGLASAFTNLSNTYNSLKQYDSALSVLKQCDHLNHPDKKIKFFSEISYGLTYFNQHNLPEAIKHYKNCIDVAVNQKMVDSEITGLTELADCYLYLGNIKLAETNYNAALVLATKHQLLFEEAEVLKGIVNLSKKQGNYSVAFNSLTQLKKIEDSLLNIEKIKGINEIESRLKLSVKEKIIAEQSLTLQTQKLASSNYKSNIVILIAVLCVAIVAFLLLAYYSQKINRLFSLIKIQKTEVEKQKEIIEEKNKDVMDSIHYAQYIQGSMLPSQTALNNLFNEIFILYKPKDVVAGDFYFTEVIDGNPAIAICDCTGHGVPGAMVSVVANNALNRAIKEYKITSPALIFDKVNELMQETFSKSDYEIKDGMDAVLCVFDYKKNQLHIAAANNPVWILSHTNDTTNDWELIQINADKQPIGKHHTQNSLFNLKTISVIKGQMIYLFTDGYADQFGGQKSKKFKHKQLQELLLLIAQKPCIEQKQILETTLANWMGNLEQVDDILIAGIRV